MARLEKDGLSAELKFFVAHDGSGFRTTVFLRMTMNDQAFPHSTHCRQKDGGLQQHWKLDPVEWWYGWDDVGSAYTQWVERALLHGRSELEPMEPWHFGHIDCHHWTTLLPIEEQIFSVLIGIDGYNIEGMPDLGMGGGSGPALRLEVTGMELKAFREAMLRDLRPQWDKYAESDTTDFKKAPKEKQAGQGDLGL